MGETAAVLRRRIDAPPELVWALVADTNRFDRASGMVPGKYEFRCLVEGDERTRTRVAHAKQMGFDIRWIEPPYDWAEGRFVSGERKFVSGPVQRGGFTVELTRDGEGTLLEAKAYVIGSGALFAGVALVMKGRFKTALEKYVGAIEEVLARTHASLGYDWDAEPPAAAARRALMTQRTDEVTSGGTSPTSEADFDYRARRFEGAPVDAIVRERLLDFLRTRPDEEVGQMRPFEIARAWGVDRREVLRGFLHAARAGLVDLQWQLNCPTCRVGADTVDSLGSAGKQAHCDACNIDFKLDFGEHVEAAFRISPSLRKVESAVYCASSPWFRPHVFAQLSIAPGEKRVVTCALPIGKLLFRTLTGARRAELVVERPPREVVIAIRDKALEVRADGVAPSRDETTLSIENGTDAPAIVLVERTGWSADVVLGSVVSTLPDFLDLFATEAPAAGVELTVSSLTLLFSDLTGSTALYERVGDARAFAIVEEHFRDMAVAIGKHGGAIIKTMGDAVMANFASPSAALRAAIDMIHACDEAHRAIGIHVKLGLHQGPCLVVRANDRLDFFGTTVNVAARLQALAGSGEIVIARELLDHQEVKRIVDECGYRTRPFESALKGIKEVQKLVAIEVALAPKG